MLQPDGTITSGTVSFKPGRFEGGGMQWLRFKAWLDEIHGAVGVGRVAFEEVRRHIGTTAGHVYGGFLAHLTAWSEANGVPYQGVPVGTIKKHATGKGNASKAQVIHAMKRLGHTPADDNEADALALLHWVIAQEVGHG
ncbi:putative bacteriophage-like protein [Magnetofaba australis IT-1]|uniref:Putative bacteriophage-like protein n=1 Tax=Magnetofaba australis IT-1 TaxID=1434232 RepID=A0A1Y2KA49_9PROT|nr:putative bacteriophage-like protein [Magnetofaba australis IT-1]